MSGESARSLEQLLDEIEGESGHSEVQTVADERAENAAAPAGNALSGLLASPQLLQTVGSLSSLLTSAQSSKGGEKTAETGKPDARALLRALRPYLGEHRRTTIDGMLQLLQLYSVLQALPLQQLLHKESK